MYLNDICVKTNTRIAKLNGFLSENFKISIDERSSRSDLISLKNKTIDEIHEMKMTTGVELSDPDYSRCLTVLETVDLMLGQHDMISEAYGNDSACLKQALQLYPNVCHLHDVNGLELETAIQRELFNHRLNPETAIPSEHIRDKIVYLFIGDNPGKYPELEAEQHGMVEGDDDGPVHVTKAFKAIPSKYDPGVPPTVHPQAPAEDDLTNPDHPENIAKRIPTVVPQSIEKKPSTVAKFAIDDKGKETMNFLADDLVESCLQLRFDESKDFSINPNTGKGIISLLAFGADDVDFTYPVNVKFVESKEGITIHNILDESGDKYDVINSDVLSEEILNRINKGI